MAEDGLIGFAFFRNERGQVVSNDAATKLDVGNPSDCRLINENAFQHANLGNAVAAVQTAIDRKFGQQPPQDNPDTLEFTETYDFIDIL